MNRRENTASRGSGQSPDGGTVTGADDAESSGRVVLVVDDEAQFAESVALWLEPGWDVIVANDGDEAVEKFGPHVDVVLLDRRMPSMSGDEALERIRAQDGDARVAMMTAVTPDWDIVDMDFDCYLEKPVSREEVVETADELVARTEYARELQALFSLASKIGLLRSRYPESELREDERFQRLEAEFQRVQEQSESMLADVDGEQFAELLQVVTDVEGTGPPESSNDSPAFGESKPKSE
ncbi:response regulator [Haloparvum sp. PAK95]|uniref:response regulator n=1 Tax=Haloparvum sp. PAK95 TaxID=3418962 RepID=UPI003D2F3DBD